MSERIGPALRACLLALALPALAACASVRDEPVPSCPYCGDPLTRAGPDGRAEIVPRLRIATWTPTSAEGRAPRTAR